MAKWLAKEFDWDTRRYTGNYYDIAEAGIVAVFVDSFFGDDTAAGTAAAPFKTLGKAITTLNSTGANGSRIFMNGIFSDGNLGVGYNYTFIGCGGGSNGKTVWYGGVGFTYSSTNGKTYKIENVETKNFNGFMLLGSGSSINASINFVNCIISNASIQGRSSTGSAYYSIIKDCISVMLQNHRGYSMHVRFCILLRNESYITFSGIGNYVYDNGSAISGNHNISGVLAQFINEGISDYNVRITSPLIGAGPVDEISGLMTNVGGVNLGIPYSGIIPEFSESGGATITDLTIDATGKYTITAPATTGTLETALMDLGNIYPLENIDLFNVFDFAAGEITQGVFETFSSPRMALTIKLKYGLTSAEVDDCPWLLIEYGKQPTFSGTGASRVGNADDTFDPDTFQTITCRYMKLFVTLQNNS